MEKSEQINELAAALCKFQSEMPPVNLDREVEVKLKTGGAYKFKYATFENIVSTARPILTKHGLSYTQIVETDSSVTTMVLHTSGQYISGNLSINATEKTAQAIGSAITYNKRYSLSSMLGIVVDDDDDGNISQGNTFTTGKKENKPPAERAGASFPQLNPKHERWKGAVEAVAKGETTLERIKKSFTIFEHNEKIFLAEVEQFKNQTA